MKKFRVANCFDELNGRIGEFAIFEDGSERKHIFTDDDGHKYFNVDNELNKDCHNILATSFTNRIKDAIDTIIAGNGDCITSFNTIGEHIKVLYFLDREYGESIRQKTIEDWKDTKFAYVIKYGSNMSFSGYCNVLNKDYCPVFNGDNRRVLYFDSYSAAKEEIEKIISKAYEYAKQINDYIPDSNTDESLVSEVSNKVYNQMVTDLGSTSNIIIDFAYDMLDDDGKFINDGNLTRLGYRIAQSPCDRMIKIKCISVPDIYSNIHIGKEYWMNEFERTMKYINVYNFNDTDSDGMVGRYRLDHFEIVEE